jgi:hypothetical protein
MVKRVVMYMALAVIAALVMAAGCVQEGKEENRANLVTGNGTIQFVDLEGGFYGITAGDGSRYYPLDLPPEFEDDGIPVSFSLAIAPENGTVAQWGRPVFIKSLRSTAGTAPVVSAYGNITRVDLEGGFSGIQVLDPAPGMPSAYDPLNLGDEFQEPGTPVRFAGIEQTDIFTTRMWGTPLEILHMEEVT